MLISQFKGRVCDIMNDKKQLVRRLHVANDIVNVQISGDGENATIAVTMKNGKTNIFKANGQLIRR